MINLNQFPGIEGHVDGSIFVIYTLSILSRESYYKIEYK